MGDDNSSIDCSANATPLRSGLPAVVAVQPRTERKERVDNSRNEGFIRRRLGAIAALAAMVAASGAGLFIASERQREGAVLAERAHETQALAQAVGALSHRLSAMEGVNWHDDLGELQRSVGEIKASVSNSKELSDALAQLSRRVDALNREANAKVEKLSERLDREPNARNAELSARIEKLEKVVASAASPSRQMESAPAQQSPAPAPKVGPNVSMQPTGSIRRPRPLLQGYVVLRARGQVALVEGRYGERAVRPGDYLPGAGRVERIERQAGAWVVLTDQGLIADADGY